MEKEKRETSSGFLRLGAIVFTVLAWLSLTAQVGVGLYLLVGGGGTVLNGGLDVPGRLVGVLNCISGLIYFFILLLISHVLRVLLDIHQRLGKA